MRLVDPARQLVLNDLGRRGGMMGKEAATDVIRGTQRATGKSPSDDMRVREAAKAYRAAATDLKEEAL